MSDERLVSDEVGDALTCWRQASRELDDVIGIDLDDEAMAPLPIPMDVRRFRHAVLAEQLAREHYVALLRDHHEPIPAELVWESPDNEPGLLVPDRAHLSAVLGTVTASQQSGSALSAQAGQPPCASIDSGLQR